MTARSTFILALAVFLSSPAISKNLDGRVGLGLWLPGEGFQPAFSARYAPYRHILLGFGAGFNTGNTNGFTFLGARVQRNFDLQENLNAFLGWAVDYLASKSGTGTITGFEIDLLFGLEIFLPGLSDLAWTIETGLAFRSLGGDSLRTLGNGFLGAGVHYYF